jgi:FkbM family methyltransferase
MLKKTDVVNGPDLAEIQIEKIKNSGLPVVLFGFGGMLPNIYDNLNQIGLDIKYICDNNPKKHGVRFKDSTVVSFEQLKKIYNKCNILISVCTPKFVDEIYKQIENDKQYTDIYFFEMFYPFGKDIHSLVIKHFDEIQKVYELLNDELSKRVFLNKINYIISKDAKYLSQIESPDEYFQQDILELSKDDVFVDMGAFHGEDTIRLIKLVGGLKYAYCFEPDKINFQVLEKSILPYPNVKSYNNAVWKENITLTFTEAGTMGSEVNKRGTVQVEGVAIDTILDGKEITFLKMDVEGAEIEALNGATKIIAKQQPKLAICVYHKITDHWEIPLLIKSLNPNYRIFMRHHDRTGIETVCYATI